MNASAAAAPEGVASRALITASVMLATVIQTLDSTIANVALPHMQGSLDATQHQISWVLTSYIVASAIFMPLTGYLAGRVGRKRLMMIAVVGFTLTSMLCGLAQNLEQMVLFRVAQGVFGAVLVPLSQAILLDTYPPEKHGQAMAMWGMGVMIGPIIGPSLGGWLTEYYNWRWVFYINLPLGLLAWAGIAAAVHETAIDRERRFDLFGFALLAIAIAALQMMLDRGQTLDWFASAEVIFEAVLCAGAFYLFIVHICTARQPFIEPALFRDRNFVVALIFVFVIGVMLLAVMALLPPFLQGLMNYPVVEVGMVMAPRGIGTMLAMGMVGRLMGRVDPRAPVVFGLLVTAYSAWEMSTFTTEVSAATIVINGFVQGFGMGFIFVPLSTMAFATLEPRLRNEGTGLYSLVRNIGSSIGIAIMVTLLASNSQINHAGLAGAIEPYAFALREAVASGVVTVATPEGLALVNAEVSRQALILAYLQDFRLVMWITLAAVPLVLLLKPPQRRAADPEFAAIE